MLEAQVSAIKTGLTTIALLWLMMVLFLLIVGDGTASFVRDDPCPCDLCLGGDY